MRSVVASSIPWAASFHRDSAHLEARARRVGSDLAVDPVAVVDQVGRADVVAPEDPAVRADSPAAAADPAEGAVIS